MMVDRLPADRRGLSMADLASPGLPFRRHLLDLDDFSRQEIELVFEVTDAMKEVLGREIRKVPTLRGKTVVNIFYEASTRTRVSFELAAKNLSADVVNITASASSVAKGESLLDTIHTIRALGADMIVMRHPQAGAPYLVAQQVAASVLNAGDGWHAHPSQALLDLYTIRQHLGRLEGLKVVIVGDILHSRVARSNLWALATMGAKATVCSPPTLLPWGLGGEDPALPPVEVDHNLDRALEGADVVMALRIQKERHQEGLLPSLEEYVRLYQIDNKRLARAKPHALLMHPGPVNEGIELAPEVVYGAQSVIQEQVANGVAVRMALLYLLGSGGGPR
jgi:aspartate carbamoyltransferase catalytic subunit